MGQALAISKTPIDLLRGSGGEEKLLKNAKDGAAAEALEIATYTALERLARSVGDDTTAQLAASIREDEERMLQRLLREIPKLTDAVVGADLQGKPTYDVTTTGAADSVRDAGKSASEGGAFHGRRREADRPQGAQGARRRAGRGSGQGRASRASPIWRSHAMTRSPRTRSSRASPICRRSTSRRSTATSASTRTAPPCSAASPRCAPASRGPATTS